jgi:predicted type IV restriction endonuclease
MSIISKIFSGGADKLVGTIGGIVDDLTLSKEEKEKLKLDTLNAINAHEEKIQEQAQAELESYLKDTQSARDSNVKIQESDKASWLAKNVGYCIDIFLILVFSLMLFVIIYKSVPADNKELFYTSFGMLGMYVGQCISFHRGTSKGSQDKGKQLDKLIGK